MKKFSAVSLLHGHCHTGNLHTKDSSVVVVDGGELIKFPCSETIENMRQSGVSKIFELICIFQLMKFCDV